MGFNKNVDIKFSEHDTVSSVIYNDYCKYYMYIEICERKNVMFSVI